MSKWHLSTLVLLLGVVFSPSYAFAKESVVEAEIISNNFPLQQIQLTEELLLKSGTQSNFNIEIVDKFGDSLPYKITKQQHKVVHLKQSVKVYPLTEVRYLQQRTKTIDLKYDLDSRLSEVKSKQDHAKGKRIVGYLLDLGKKRSQRTTLTFQLSDVKETRFMKMDIDQSSNLKRWRRISNAEVLAQLVYEDVIASQNKIFIRSTPSRYLRLTIKDNRIPFKIISAQQDYTEKSSSKPDWTVWTKTKQMVFDEKQQAYILALSPAISYQDLKIEMPKAPAIISASLSNKVIGQKNWKTISELSFININDKNHKILENITPLRHVRYSNQLKFSIRYATPKLNQQPLRVALSYLPQNLTFYASGNTPYKIRLSHSKNQMSTSNNAQLLSKIQTQIRSPIGYAKLGDSQMVEIDEPSVVKKTNWNKIGLWIVLISGVIMMAWMAKNLLKQID